MVIYVEISGHELCIVWRRLKLENKIWHSGHNRHNLVITEKILTIRAGIYGEYLHSSILRESHNDHNSRTSNTRDTNDLLEPQQIQVDNEDKKIKQNAM